MLLKKQVLFLFVFIILFSVTTSVFANSPHIIYDKSYVLDGTIMMKMQAGDSSNSTAEHKTLVEGRGSLERSDKLRIGRGYLDIITDSSWKAENTLIGGLTVASTVKLNETVGDASETGSKQVFAVLVKANPGEEGALSQEMSAASEVYGDGGETLFVIDQRAYTSGGTVKRYIDLTEPVTGEYLFEDSFIKGYVEITDSLRIADDDTGQLIFEIGEGLDDDDDQITAEDSGVAEEAIYILYGEGMFHKEVLVGTLLEEVGLISSIDLVSDLAIINDIPIEWCEDSLVAYDPEQTGNYLFEGELIFPDIVTAPGIVIIQYSVEVVENITESDHLEDAVHGGDNGEDEDPDEEADDE